ncbi:MAG: hypothetical protein ACRD2O_13915, partial [Terriglobia bacterium]
MSTAPRRAAVTFFAPLFSATSGSSADVSLFPLIFLSVNPKVAQLIFFNTLFSASSGSLAGASLFLLIFLSVNPEIGLVVARFPQEVFDNPFVFSKDRVWKKRNPLFLTISLLVRH